MLTIDDIAERLRVSASHVRRLIEKGLIPHKDLSVDGSRKLVRVEESWLQEYIDGKTTDSPSPVPPTRTPKRNWAVTKAK